MSTFRPHLPRWGATACVIAADAKSDRPASSIAMVSRSAPVSRSAGRSRQASATAASTCRKDGIPIRGSGGKYVPPWNGFPSGVRKTLIGHPPWPVSCCTALM